MDEREASEKLDFVLKKAIPDIMMCVKSLAECVGGAYDFTNIEIAMKGLQGRIEGFADDFRKTVERNALTEIAKSSEFTGAKANGVSPYIAARNYIWKMIAAKLPSKEVVPVSSENADEVVKDILANDLKGVNLVDVMKKKGLLSEGGNPYVS